jgi:hypothetical protein
METNPDLSQEHLAQWLEEFRKSPLLPLDTRGARDLSDPEQDPEVALQLDPSGVPVWWPHQHPATNAPLSEDQRKSWFLWWLGGELSPLRTQLRNGERRSVRQMIARCLLLTHSDYVPQELPIPDSL